MPDEPRTGTRPVRRARIKRLLATAAVGRVGRAVFRPLVRDRVAVFMLHRFSEPDLGIQGDDPKVLRRALETLRAHRVPLLSLETVVQRARTGEGGGGVAFTVDDGYSDFHHAGAPLFRELDVPVTVFLSTGFIDGRYWFWWDKLAYACDLTGRETISISDLDLRLRFSSIADREGAAGHLAERIKALPQGLRNEMINQALDALEVDIPTSPPPNFSPMTWDQIRSASSQGVDFGPHTINHPSLATLGPAESQREISGSFRRLQEELDAPLPVFCFPYGLEQDVSHGAASLVQAAGLHGALTAIPGYVSSDVQTRSDPFLLPRFAMPNNLADISQIAFGFQRFKEVSRSFFGLSF